MYLPCSNFAKNMEEGKSVYRYSAERALFFGIYMSVVSVCSIYSDRVPLFSLPVMLMLLAVPVAVYKQQLGYARLREGMVDYASLWMVGILQFVLGALITALVTYVVIRFTRPAFIYEQAQSALEVYGTIPELADSQLVAVLNKAVESNMLPTPIEMVVNIYWFVTFGGCMLSAITAAFAHMRRNVW